MGHLFGKSATKPASALTVSQSKAIRRRGFVGKKGLRGRYAGSVAFIPVPLQWRATTRHVCGLYPFSAPGALPMVGGPIGVHEDSGAVVCFDHINFFKEGLIGNPSVLIIAKPGLGKSTLCNKIVINLAAQGYILTVPGDTKPDYAETVRALGGQIWTVSRSGGAALNPCDPGGMGSAAARIGGAGGDALLAEAIGRATVCICTLIELGRNGSAVKDYEQAAISAALRALYDAKGPEPLLVDVVQFLGTRPVAVRAILVDRDDDAIYDALIEPLRRSLNALLGGQFGDVFSRRVQRPAGKPVAFCLDTSKIASGDPKFLAAVLIAAWSDTYGMVEANQAMADAGQAERSLYCLVLDELWRVLQLGGTMSDRINELTRLNRTTGIGQIMITHSIRDLAGGKDSRVQGLEERAGAILIGGVPKREIKALEELVTLSRREKRRLTKWWSQKLAGSAKMANRFQITGSNKKKTPRRPPGSGLFLLKTSSEEPGIPINVQLSSTEIGWGGQNTNLIWTETGAP